MLILKPLTRRNRMQPMKNLSRPKAALEANGAEFVSNEEFDKLKAEKKAAGSA